MPRSFQIACVLASLSAAGLALFATATHGSGLMADSVSYIATARNLKSHFTAVTYNGAPLLVHPPLYPLVLAGVSALTGFDALQVAPAINADCPTRPRAARTERR
jgi:hypothetical protein